MIKLLKDDDWYLDRINGSHRVMKKDDKTEIIPVQNTKAVKKKGCYTVSSRM